MTPVIPGGGDSAKVHLAGLSPAGGNRVRMVTRVWEGGAMARVHKLRRIPSGDGRRGIGCCPSPCLTGGFIVVVDVCAGLCRSWLSRDFHSCAAAHEWKVLPM